MSSTKQEDFDVSFIIDQARGRNRKPNPYISDSETTENISSAAELEKSAEAEPSAESTSSDREAPKRRKGKNSDYERLFIRKAPSNTRSGKTVYIRQEFHERILRIVQVIGRNEISLYSYLDNVLAHHFEIYQDEISTLYHNRNQDIF